MLIVKNTVGFWLSQLGQEINMSPCLSLCVWTTLSTSCVSHCPLWLAWLSPISFSYQFKPPQTFCLSLPTIAASVASPLWSRLLPKVGSSPTRLQKPLPLRYKPLPQPVYVSSLFNNTAELCPDVILWYIYIGKSRKLENWY